MTFYINKNRNINIDFTKSNIGKTSFNSKNNYLELLRNGEITQAEYNKIINGEAFKFTETGTSSLFGLELSTNKTSSQDDVKQKTHPHATDLVMDEDGNIDLEQFSLEKILLKNFVKLNP